MNFQFQIPPLVTNPIFFLDYDGTLAPLVEHPMSAYPHREARDLLVRLDERYPLWIVTGRHLRDLKVLLDLPLQAIGLHGAQAGAIGAEIASRVPEDAAAAIAALRRTLPQVEGAWVEEKEHTFALHFRTIQEAALKDRLGDWLAAIPEHVDTVWGKKVLELRAKGVSKGVAVTRIAEQHPERTPVYLGDDVTDEDAFRMLDRDAVTVKVGDGETLARYRLPDVDAVIAYLQKYAM